MHVLISVKQSMPDFMPVHYENMSQKTGLYVVAEVLRGRKSCNQWLLIDCLCYVYAYQDQIVSCQKVAMSLYNVSTVCSDFVTLNLVLKGHTFYEVHPSVVILCSRNVY